MKSCLCKVKKYLPRPGGYSLVGVLQGGDEITVSDENCPVSKGGWSIEDFAGKGLEPELRGAVPGSFIYLKNLRKSKDGVYNADRLFLASKAKRDLFSFSNIYGRVIEQKGKKNSFLLAELLLVNNAKVLHGPLEFLNSADRFLKEFEEKKLIDQGGFFLRGFEGSRCFTSWLKKGLDETADEFLGRLKRDYEVPLRSAFKKDIFLEIIPWFQIPIGEEAGKSHNILKPKNFIFEGTERYKKPMYGYKQIEVLGDRRPDGLPFIKYLDRTNAEGNYFAGQVKSPSLKKGLGIKNNYGQRVNM